MPKYRIEWRHFLINLRYSILWRRLTRLNLSLLRLTPVRYVLGRGYKRGPFWFPNNTTTKFEIPVNKNHPFFIHLISYYVIIDIYTPTPMLEMCSIHAAKTKGVVNFSPTPPRSITRLEAARACNWLVHCLTDCTVQQQVLTNNINHDTGVTSDKISSIQILPNQPIVIYFLSLTIIPLTNTWFQINLCNLVKAVPKTEIVLKFPYRFPDTSQQQASFSHIDIVRV